MNLETSWGWQDITTKITFIVIVNWKGCWQSPICYSFSCYSFTKRLMCFQSLNSLQEHLALWTLKEKSMEIILEMLRRVHLMDSPWAYSLLKRKRCWHTATSRSLFRRRKTSLCPTWPLMTLDAFLLEELAANITRHHLGKLKLVLRFIKQFSNLHFQNWKAQKKICDQSHLGQAAVLLQLQDCSTHGAVSLLQSGSMKHLL